VLQSNLVVSYHTIEILASKIRVGSTIEMSGPDRSSVSKSVLPSHTKKQLHVARFECDTTCEVDCKGVCTYSLGVAS